MTAGTRKGINAQGGLITRAALAERWGVSRERVRQLSHEKGFPKPVQAEGVEVWLVADVDRWRDKRTAYINSKRSK